MTNSQLTGYLETYDRLKEEIVPKLSRYQIQEIMASLHRLEATLCRLAIQDCNYGLTEKEEKKKNSAKERVKDIISLLGEFKVKFNSDPRGGAIRLLLPSGKSNNWDGETWGIYW